MDMKPDPQDSFSSLADNEAWLADNSDKMVQAQDEAPYQVQDNVPGKKRSIPVRLPPKRSAFCAASAQP